MDVAAHVSSSSLRSITGACHQVATVLRAAAVDSLSDFTKSKWATGKNPSPRACLPVRFATTVQRRRQLMARRDQIFPRDVRAVDLNLISRLAPFDDTVLPVIFSYRRVCIRDARPSLGDVSQSAQRARKRCGAREARVDRFGVAGPRETLCNYRAW